jgi:hypothetical protein
MVYDRVGTLHLVIKKFSGTNKKVPEIGELYI